MALFLPVGGWFNDRLDLSFLIFPMSGSGVVIQDGNQPVYLREILPRIIREMEISQCHCPVGKHIDMGMNMNFFCVSDP